MSIPVLTGIQKRSVVAELRAKPGYIIEGHAALFNNQSKDLGGFRETIKPGAFSRSLAANADVKALFNHQPDNILGRTKSGTLKLREDSRGLSYTLQLNPNSQAHRDLYEAIKRGDISENSFAFTVPKNGQKWDEGPAENGQPMYARTLLDVDLIDISPVTYPAYDGTDATARQLRNSADYGVGDEATKRLVEAAATRSGSDLAFQIRTLRKAAQLLARDFARVCRDVWAQRGEDPNGGSQVDFASHMQRCAEYAEFLQSQMDQARSVYDAGDPDAQDDWDDDADLDSSFRKACAHSEFCANELAAARAHHGRAVAAKKRGY